MSIFFQKFVKVCPKTGRIKKITLPGGFYKLLFPFIGIAAMVWILIRVIPKPSRLSYPASGLPCLLHPGLSAISQC